jgi:hypothetical protein
MKESGRSVELFSLVEAGVESTEQFRPSVPSLGTEFKLATAIARVHALGLEAIGGCPRVTLGHPVAAGD